MELKVEEFKELAPVKFNYEDIKQWVTEKAEEYKKVVYTEDTIAIARTDRATLHKFSDAINNEKKRIKNELLKPYVDFENKCKELMAIIDDASKCIDTQVKAFENKEQEEKKNQILEIFNAYIGNYKELISFEKIFNPRWLNKTYSMKKIEEEINHLIVKTNTDLGVIDGQFKDESVNKAAKIEYFSNISNPNVLTLSMLKGNSIIENNKKLEELKKQQDAKNDENASKNIQDAPMQVTEEKMEICFKVIATKEQFLKLKEFLETNNIDYRRI